MIKEKFNNYSSEEIKVKKLFKTIKKNKKYFLSILGVFFILFALNGKNIKEKYYKGELRSYFEIGTENFEEQANSSKLLNTIEQLLEIELNEKLVSKNKREINSNNNISVFLKDNANTPYEYLNLSFIDKTNILRINFKATSLIKASERLLEISQELEGLQNIRGIKIQDLINYYSIKRDSKGNQINPKVRNQKDEDYEISYFKIIEEPFIVEIPIFNFKQYYLISLFLSSIIAIILIFIKERISPFITEFEILAKTIDQNYIDTITLDKSAYSKKNIQYIFKKNNIPLSLGVINGGEIGLKSREEYLINYFQKLGIDLDLVNIFDEKSINKYEKLLIFLPENLCKYSDLKILNNYLKFYQDKIIGWIYLKEN